MEKIWEELLRAAKSVLNARQVSQYVSCGQVAAAVRKHLQYKALMRGIAVYKYIQTFHF